MTTRQSGKISHTVPESELTQSSAYLGNSKRGSFALSWLSLKFTMFKKMYSLMSLLQAFKEVGNSSGVAGK